MFCSVPVFAQLKMQFQKKGLLSFEKIAVEQMIDKQCGSSGDTSQPLKMAQNEAKNNFWEKNAPIEVDFNIFRRLESETNKKINSKEIKTKVLKEHEKINIYPINRKDLVVKLDGQTYHEGTVVVLEAYLIGSHYSNVGSGESVNCSQKWMNWNDIHIVLGKSKNSAMCETVTAEISPHFRPNTWARFHDRTNKTIDKKITGLPIIGEKVRLIGPLFYDASHKGCKDGQSQGSPVRMTIWEIHPIYQIEIFDQTNQKWVELDEWAKTH